MSSYSTQMSLRDIWRSLWPTLRPHSGQLAFAAIALILSVATQVARPWPLKLVIDYVLGRHAPPDLIGALSKSEVLLACKIGFVALAFLQG